MNKQKGSASFVLIVSLLVVLLICLGLIFWHNYSKNSQVTDKKVDSSTSKDVIRKRTGLLTEDSTSIWAGYVTNDKNKYISVEGRIKVPGVICKDETDSFSAWTGFDGYGGTNTVQQIGFSAACNDASGYAPNKPISGVTYYAWAMTFGAGNYDVLSMDIKPGDVIFYKVTYNNGRYDMTIRNETQQSSQFVSYACKNEEGADDTCPRRMVEWIVERPGNGSMAKFPMVTLYDNMVTTEDGKMYTPNELDTYKVDMVQSGTILAKTSDIAAKGTFDVSWRATGQPGE